MASIRHHLAKGKTEEDAESYVKAYASRQVFALSKVRQQISEASIDKKSPHPPKADKETIKPVKVVSDDWDPIVRSVFADH